VVVLDLLAEAMVEAIYEGKAKGYLLDAYPMNLEQVIRHIEKYESQFHIFIFNFHREDM
jgi:hypothetical protein